MSLFSKIIGGDKKEEKPDGASAREHERLSADGISLTIMSTGQKYGLNDISPGGVSIRGYEGKLHGNQYFEFKLTAQKGDQTMAQTGMAIVVRVKDENLAAKFPPQPRLRQFLRDFYS
jgi:hypothetical protein